ncbi:MAG: efflux RND transporter periplasmic adaptor subunit [Deltaproteobacteria bacterium]|nr:efflux RND transporter periplasmic adaptor subunit [Deltaproteobacteria bacterium]
MPERPCRHFLAGSVLPAVLVLLSFFCLTSCRENTSSKPQKQRPPQAVTVVLAEKKTVPVWIEYIGTTSAVKEVSIRARVEGFLQSRDFVEGGDVKMGQQLYLIEPDPYKVKLDKAKAQLEQAEAALVYATSQVVRYEPLTKLDFSSPDTLEDYKTKEREAQASVASAKADIEQASINLGYCTIFSPISGRVGKTVYDIGNLVGQTGQDSVLTTVVQLDPIYINFSPSEKDFEAIMTYKKDGVLRMEAGMASVDGGYPFTGEVDFIANEVDQVTGTVAMRATVKNPGFKLLPGMYVRVRLYMNDIPGMILIPKQALAEDQGGQYVYTVGNDNKVEQMRVVSIFDYQGLAVVQKGLDGHERVITEGQQKVRPGMEVQPSTVAASKYLVEADGQGNATSPGDPANATVGSKAANSTGFAE